MDIFGLCVILFLHLRSFWMLSSSPRRRPRLEPGRARTRKQKKKERKKKKKMPQEESQIMSVLNKARGVIRALGPLLFYVVCESSAGNRGVLGGASRRGCCRGNAVGGSSAPMRQQEQRQSRLLTLVDRWIGPSKTAHLRLRAAYVLGGVVVDSGGRIAA